VRVHNLAAAPHPEAAFAESAAAAVPQCRMAFRRTTIREASPEAPSTRGEPHAEGSAEGILQRIPEASLDGAQK
jgi:hypothetical protein